MTAKPVHIAILMCRIRLKDGQTVSALVTSQGDPGEDVKMVLGNALWAAMIQYQATPENNITGFGIDEVQLRTIAPDAPETVPAKPKPSPKPLSAAAKPNSSKKPAKTLEGATT